MYKLPKTNVLNDEIVNNVYSEAGKKRKYAINLIQNDNGEIENGPSESDAFYEHPELKGFFASIPNNEIISTRSGKAKFVGTIEKGKGYPRIYYRENGENKYKYSHRFMAEIFLENYSNSDILHHIKKNKENPCILGLENVKNTSLHKEFHDKIKNLYYWDGDQWGQPSPPSLEFLALIFHTDKKNIYNLLQNGKKEYLNNNQKEYIIKGDVETWDEGIQNVTIKIDEWS